MEFTSEPQLCLAGLLAFIYSPSLPLSFPPPSLPPSILSFSFLCFLGTVSLCSPGACCVEQAGLELTEIDLTLPPEWGGLQFCASIANAFIVYIFCEYDMHHLKTI